MNEPKNIYKGTTSEWTESLADYPASEWTLTYYFRGAGTGIDVVGVADGNDFALTITATASNTLSIGTYKFQAIVTKDDEVFLVSEGIVNVKAGLASVLTSTTHETRSANQIILDKIRAMISGAMDKNVQEYTINNRQLRHYTLSELIELETYYSKKVSQEVTNSTGHSSPFLKSRKFNHVKHGLS